MGTSLWETGGASEASTEVPGNVIVNSIDGYSRLDMRTFTWTRRENELSGKLIGTSHE